MVFVAAGKALHSVRVGRPDVSNCVKEVKPLQVGHLSDHVRDFCVGKCLNADADHATGAVVPSM